MLASEIASTTFVEARGTATVGLFNTIDDAGESVVKPAFIVCEAAVRGPSC